MNRRRLLILSARLAGVLPLLPALPAAARDDARPASPLGGGEGTGPWVLGERIQGPSANGAGAGHAPAPATLADTDWDSLIPPDWDALREFERLDFSTMTDADPRARDALRKLQAAWQNAPANPAMDGREIRIPGFVVPLDEARGPLREFLLVPYFGACIHVPPPPSNQVIHVIADPPVRGIKAMDAVRVTGRLRIARTDTAMGSASWTMTVRGADRYDEPPERGGR